MESPTKQIADNFIQSIRDKKADPKVLQRFFAFFVERENSECWPWIGHCNVDSGVGRFTLIRTIDTRIGVSAKRIQWELYMCPIPSRTVISLSCGTRNCMNPAHMTVSI